ncbi:MAG: class I SAM-dependent methyltransferase [Acidimicrobiales bacterium]
MVGRLARDSGTEVALHLDGRRVEPDPLVWAADVDLTAPPLRTAAAWLPGFVRERLLDASARRRHGVHHTPPAMAIGLVELVGSVVPFDESTVVLDPAVGGGAFLLAVAERLPGERRQIVTRLRGVDLDPLAVATTRAALELWSGGVGPDPGSLLVGDGLAARPWSPQPTVVIGNPPFRAQLRSSTARGRDDHGARRNRWPEVRRYVDEAAAFLLVGVEHVADGGLVALVQPASVFGALDAIALRDRLLESAPPRAVWIDGEAQFGAAVDTVAVVLQKGGVAGPVRRAVGVPPEPVRSTPAPLPGTSWASLLRPGGAPVVGRERMSAAGTLGDVARVTAGLRSVLRPPPPSSTIPRADTPHDVGPDRPARGALGHGRLPVRSSSVASSSVRLDAVDPGVASWFADRLVPKLLVASQTKVLEVVVDEAGEWLPCTPVVSVEPTEEAPSLWHVAAALTAPVVTAWLVDEAAGTALSRDAVRVSAAVLCRVPLPGDRPAWDRAAEAARDRGMSDDRGSLLDVARLALAAYGLPPDHPTLAWWQQRLPRR